MPVDTGRSGGERSRHYKGQSSLGQLLQWDCPACGMKVEAATHPVEQGCPHCGAGTPGTAAPPRPSSTVEPVAPSEVESTPRRRPARPVDPPSVRPVERSESVVYRLIEYRGTPEWLTTTLQRSLVGSQSMGLGTITACIVDSVDVRQQDLITLAGRQPGVWLGQAAFKPTIIYDKPGTSRPVSPPAGGALAELSRLYPSVTSPVTPPKETRPMANTPSTGPTPTNDDYAIAEVLYPKIGNIGCYTLAMALNQFATVVEDETMEPEKYWSAQQCLGVANALLQLIPQDWQPTEAPTDGPHDARD